MFIIGTGAGFAYLYITFYVMVFVFRMFMKLSRAYALTAVIFCLTFYLFCIAVVAFLSSYMFSGTEWAHSLDANFSIVAAYWGPDGMSLHENWGKLLMIPYVYGFQLAVLIVKNSIEHFTMSMFIFYSWGLFILKQLLVIAHAVIFPEQIVSVGKSIKST